MACPAGDISITPLKMCLCTYGSKLDMPRTDVAELSELLAGKIDDVYVAVNSNFVHACNGRYPHLLKDLSKVERRIASFKRPRKLQGDGSCFNGAVEVCLRPGGPSEERIYKVKLFPGTGTVQLPGVVMEDLSDGKMVVDMLADLLEVPRPLPESTSIKMLNYNFKVQFGSENESLNLAALHKFLHTKPKTMFGLPVLLSDYESVKVVVLFGREGGYEVSKPSPHGKCTALLYRSGKILLLGMKNPDMAKRLHYDFTQLILQNGKKFVSVQPAPDQCPRQPRTLQPTC